MYFKSIRKQFRRKERVLYVQNFVAMKQFIITCLFLDAVECVLLLSCPTKCECRDSKIECEGVMPHFIPKNITKVIVRELGFGKKFDFTEIGWQNVTYLSINPGLSVFHNHQKAYRALNDYEFAKLLNLEYLQIACKCLRRMQKKAFGGLVKLKVLDLSNNIDLSKDDLVQGLSEDNLPSLRELYLSNISVIQVGSGTFLIGSEFYDAVRNKPLKVLDLSEIEDAWFDSSSSLDTAFPFLEHLNISGAGTAVLSFSKALLDMRNPNVTSFKNLKILDVSYPFTSSKMSDLFFGRQFYEDTIFYAPQQLEEVYAKRYFRTPVKLNGISNSTHACLLPEPEESNIKVCVIGKFDHLKKAIFSENTIAYIHPNLAYAIKSVQYLDLSKDDLGDALTVDGYASSILEILNKLEVLLASENKITSLPENTFKHSKLLQTIDFSNNFFKAVTFRTDYLVSLKYLDLS